MSITRTMEARRNQEARQLQDLQVCTAEEAGVCRTPHSAGSVPSMRARVQAVRQHCHACRRQHLCDR